MKIKDRWMHNQNQGDDKVFKSVFYAAESTDHKVFH